VPGGRLVAQCGGEGNIAAVEAAIERVRDFGGWSPWNFASPAATEERLRRLGWTDVWTWSNPVDVRPDDPREYFATVVLGSHLERVPAGERDAFVDAVLDALDEPVVRYVRLNILGRRPS
jgi:trans-aconitate 2-methyltransferase